MGKKLREVKARGREKIQGERRKREEREDKMMEGKGREERGGIGNNKIHRMGFGT